MCVTEVLFTLLKCHMIAAVADCFSALKNFRKKSPDPVFNKLGDLPILWPSNLEAQVRKLSDSVSDSASVQAASVSTCNTPSLLYAHTKR